VEYKAGEKEWLVKVLLPENLPGRFLWKGNRAKAG
jgi:hypothetical protein